MFREGRSSENDSCSTLESVTLLLTRSHLRSGAKGAPRLPLQLSERAPRMSAYYEPMLVLFALEKIHLILVCFHSLNSLNASLYPKEMHHRAPFWPLADDYPRFPVSRWWRVFKASPRPKNLLLPPLLCKNATIFLLAYFSCLVL